ncbi:hypothetical protein PR202_gb07612 [Eleusine coracana subsp. coracana]|uniref:VQ domain-containing protein n=1 Tax=Eleusine coracana subsp. coracana TaxID=191504 RepID=A0AAV5ECL8_ELECO|nr:hypothetical protein PR202_gb07612 [Eleusine coracana subsp. coracana]
MESSNNNANKQQQAGGNPGRTHWRRRDPSATAVYVVHPTQFRDVVQQLTGAPATRDRDQGDNNGNAAARQQHDDGGASKGGEERGSRQRTLGQMHQECMAWANSDE